MGRERILDEMPLLADLKTLRVGANDILVHAPGFEDRTLSIVGVLEGSAGASAILLDYLPLNPDNRLAQVRHGLAAKGIEAPDSNIIRYNRFNPAEYPDVLRGRLIAGAAQHVVVDVSTMSKLAVILTLKVCLDLNLEVTVVYSEAETYGPSQEEFEAAKANSEIHRPTLQIFTGVYGVVRAGSLASVAMQGQPTAALVFMSFNDALTQVLLNTVYPSRLLLINGRPPVHKWREHATAWIHDEVRREWESDNPTTAAGRDDPLPARAVSTLDYRETVSLLVELYWELSETHRILLAPEGSKMQAVGCFFAKALHPDIHIEYPSPDGFLPQYSSGVGRKWLLRFGRLSELIGRIGAAERRCYLELPISSEGKPKKRSRAG